MFFRPEEIHGASGKGDVIAPLPEGDRHICHQSLGFALQDHSIPDFHTDGLPAIQTGRIDPDRLTRKQPADRQRFKPSLAEPLLLAVNSDTILRGEVVKRSK